MTNYFMKLGKKVKENTKRINTLNKTTLLRKLTSEGITPSSSSSALSAVARLLLIWLISSLEGTRRSNGFSPIVLEEK